MANDYTTRLKKRLPGIGDENWDDEWHDNEKIDDVVLGALLTANRLLSGGAVTLGTGLVPNYAAMKVLVAGVVYDIAGGSIAATAAVAGQELANWLYISSVGVVTISTIPPTGNYVPLALVDTSDLAVIRLADLRPLVQVSPGFFVKTDSGAVSFTKTAAGAIAIKAGTAIEVAGARVTIVMDTAVVMPALVAGTDYAVYACTDGTIRADGSFTAPAGYTTANSRQIGGFHYGLVAPGTAVGIASGFSNTSAVTQTGTTTSASAIITALASTAALHPGLAVTGTGIGVNAVVVSVDSATQITLSVASTASATLISITCTNTGMVWAQADVDKLAGINRYSLWDLKFRPLCDPKGMALVSDRTWVDIYLCSTDHIANGTSKAGTNIASGTVLPKKPLEFGGNGTATYAQMTWWDSSEIAAASKKRLLQEQEFVVAAFGVIENRSIDTTAATYPATQRNIGYTSKYGVEQASGHHWTWGSDGGHRPDTAIAWAYNNVNGGRGQIYLPNAFGIVRALFGGNRTSGVNSGSRCAYWSSCPWISVWYVGLRAACDHLQLV